MFLVYQPSIPKRLNLPDLNALREVLPHSNCLAQSSMPQSTIPKAACRIFARRLSFSAHFSVKIEILFNSFAWTRICTLLLDSQIGPQQFVLFSQASDNWADTLAW